MVKIEEVDRYRYLFAALLTLLVFMMGVAASNFLDDTRKTALEDNRDENFLDLESQQLQLQYIQAQGRSCSVMKTGLNNIVQDYNARLNDLSTFKQNSVLNKKDYEKLKRSYILSGIRYWMFSQELRQKCGDDSSTILFFTTTLDKEDCDECETVAHELDLLKNVYGEELLIFSVPTRLEDGMVNVLQERYNVTEEPTLVLDGNKTLEGYHHRSEIKEELNLSDPQ